MIKFQMQVQDLVYYLSMKVSIVDDHTFITEAIQAALSRVQGVFEVSIFNSPFLFLEQMSLDSHPDILITDLVMPGMGGLELIEKCKALLKSNIRIIIFSTINNTPTVRHALRLGANGYLSKDSSTEELMDAVSAIMRGKQYISKSIQKSFMDSIVTEEQVIFYLTPREKQILELICNGKTVKEIRSELNLSINTINSYHKNILRKFKLNRTVDLVAFAIRHGLYNPH